METVQEGTTEVPFQYTADILLVLAGIWIMDKICGMIRKREKGPYTTDGSGEYTCEKYHCCG